MKKSFRYRRCSYCGCKFIPDKYNYYHQKHCGKKECQKSINRLGSKRYRRKKRHDSLFRKKEVRRVQLWRKKNPGYQANKKSAKNSENN